MTHKKNVQEDSTRTVEEVALDIGKAVLFTGVVQGFSAVEEFVSSLESSTNTKESYLRHIRSFGEWASSAYGTVNYLELTRVEVQGYISHLEKLGKSPSTVSAHYSAICSYCRWSGQEDACSRIRKTKVQSNVTPKALDRTEELRLIRDVHKTGKNRDIAIVQTLLQTGLRVSELCSLDVQDIEINERSGSLTVRNGKGKKFRKIPLSSEVRRSLSDYLGTDQRKGPLFLTNRGTRIKARMVQRICSQFGTNPHALRHTFITRLVRSGADLVSVSRLAGHESINTTAIYANPTDDEMSGIIDKAFN